MVTFKRRQVIGLVLAVLLCTTSPAAALCVGGVPLCESFWSYEMVFEGSVSAIVQEPGRAEVRWNGMQIEHQVVTFDVRRRWRGDPASQVQLIGLVSDTRSGHPRGQRKRR
jgi:hypothetical protein